MPCTTRSSRPIPSSSPNRIRTRSPENDDERDTITTPSASRPTNSSPIAVSLDRRERSVISVTPPIIAIAPTAAPIIPGTPSRSAAATPGSTPWASASPMNARPRSTTYVPTTAHAIDTRIPARSACWRNSLSRNGSTRSRVHQPIRGEGNDVRIVLTQLGAPPSGTRPGSLRCRAMDIRIGVTQSPREIAIELADDIDRAELQVAGRGGAERCGRRAVGHRQEQPRRRRRRREDRVRGDRQPRRATAAWVSAADAARAPTALRHRQGRRRQDDGGGCPRRARRQHGQARARVRDGREGRARRRVRGGRARLRAEAGAPEPVGDGDEHRGLAARVPAAVRAHPARRSHRPAGAHVRLRRRRGARREGDPRRRQDLLRGARAALRPRRRRRRGERPHRRPDRRAAGDPRARPGRPRPRPDRTG